MSSKHVRLTGRLAGILGLLANAGDAAAQVKHPPPASLPPVEVVVTRIPEAPHDVPASVEVISGANLRARGVRSLADALRLAAGVSIAPGGDAGPAGAVPEFWGLREFDAFLLVVDGIPWGGAFNPALATLSLRDVERIEVLRGPAPVTYGATSFVGVIHVVHTAAAAKSRDFAAGGGSFGSANAAVNLPLPLGSWDSRVSADFARAGFKDDRTSFTRGHGLWRIAKIGDDRKTWLTADVNILKQDPASPHPRIGPALSTAIPVDANHNPANAFLNENRFALSAGIERPVMHGAQWGTAASFTHSAQRIFRGFLTDPEANTNNAAGFKENIDITDLYADTHIIWPAKSHLQFLTGADILLGNGEGKGATFAYSAPLSGATEPNVAEPTTLDKDAEDSRVFAGLYGSAEYRPASRVTLSGGLRLNATSEKHGEENESVSNTKLSGSVGAMFGLWEQGEDHLRVFANYRSTFKPAAFDFSLAENEEVLKPETSRSYEGGLKARLMDGKLDVEASGFQMDFENLVTATTVNGIPALINAGTTRFKGFELAADIRLPHDVFARGTFSAHDGKFVDFVQDFGGVPTQLAGKRFEMSAKQLWSAGVALSPDRGFIGSASVNYVGDRYLNKRNTALVEGYSTFDAGIGYRTERLEVRIDGRNLGDRRDAVSESEFGDAQYYLMPARSFRASIVVRY